MCFDTHSRPWLKGDYYFSPLRSTKPKKLTSPARTHVHASVVHPLTSSYTAFPASHNSPLQRLAREVPDVCISILLQCPEHRNNLGLDQLLALFPTLAAIIEEGPDDLERLGDVEADIWDGIGGKT